MQLEKKESEDATKMGSLDTRMVKIKATLENRDKFRVGRPG